MARLLTIGWDSNSTSEGGPTSLASISSTVASPAFSGGKAIKFATGAGATGGNNRYSTGAGALGRRYSGSFQFWMDAVPAISLNAIIQANDVGNSFLLGITVDTSGALAFSANGSQFGGSSAPISVGAWHLVEFKYLIDTGAADEAYLAVDGVVVTNLTGISLTDTLPTSISFGPTASVGANQNWYYDSLRLNDSTGATDTALPVSTGRLVLLLPTADSAIGSGWTTGSGAGSSLFAAVSNTPPIGAADTGTNTSQIRNASSAASNYVATLQTYTVGGIAAGATINAVQAVAVVGAPSVTGAKTGALGVAANPAVTALSFGNFFTGSTAGTYPTGWKWVYGTNSVAPSVTLGTAPTVTVNITGGTASRIADACFAGLYVDYSPSGATSGPIASTDGADIAAIATTVTTGAAVAATDTKDTAAVAASVTTGASIAATDARDVAAVVAATWTTAGIAATDGADVAAVVAANWTNSAIAATDAGDGAALIATVSSATSATIAATDAADQASIAAANWTTALLASIDAGDIAAIEGSGGAATQRFVPGHKHEGGEYQLPRRRYRTEEEIRQRRIELGIIPAPVEKVVAKAARRVIAKAQAQARADSAQDFDALAYLQEHQAQQRANLAADLRKRQIQAGLDEQRTYMILLSIEIEAQVMQEREDEQILALLLEM